MVYIKNENLLKAIRKLRNLAQVVSENPEYFSDWFDFDVIDTCKEVSELLNPKNQWEWPKKN